MKLANRRTCSTCGSEFSGGLKFCPVCMLRMGLAGEAESGESSPEYTLKRTSQDAVQRFDQYELVTGEDGQPLELGRGAMGITYKAFDVDLHCPVTLKVISERYLADESARLRFQREARAAASVRHPNVASVFHLGRTGQNYFYAMEFVAGETLENLIKRSGRLAVKLALDIATQVAAGLVAVHKQKLVHRDIKPSNVMVSLEDGDAVVAKLIDLGLAKAASEALSEAAISIPGAFAGTPEFASPEQFAGVGVDIRSDLYSLGVTLWEMLVGRAPFKGSSVEVMYQHQHAPLPEEQLKGIPQPLVVLLEVLLAKDPVRRFQNPAELLKVMPTVRDAINAGCPMMKTIRVFVSSTGDVQKERHVADRVMCSIGAEFNLPVCSSYSIFQRLAEEDGGPEDGAAKTEPDNHNRLILCPYFLEYQRLQLDAGCQGAIPNIAEFDLVICILWSRLGALLIPTLRMPDGSEPGSGTEYEIGWALDHAGKNSGVPQLRIYRNCSKPTPPLEPKEERDAFIRQWDLVQEFFAHRETNSEGKFVGTFNNYCNLQEFEELFREHFRDFLSARVEQEAGQKLLSRKVRRWKSNPFRGLKVFDFEHAPIFHGRTRAIGDVLEALEAQVKAQRPFVLVVGASGSGKSSLVRAGVLPLLTQPETIEGVGLWRWSVTRPGAGGSGGDCFDALAAALLEPPALPALQDPESGNAIRDLGSELREHSDSVVFRIRDALDHAAREWKIQRCHSLEEKERQLRGSGRSDDADAARQQRERFELPKARLALVVDQLEELFTTGFSPELRQKYISAIAGLVRSGRVFVVATLRNDFYASYQEFPELIELTKPGGKIDLRPPTPAEIVNMIRLPAEAAGLHFEQDRETGQRLDQALRDTASATQESLPLLEHVLSLLYDQQSSRGDDLLRWSDYRELGELKGALAKHAEMVFSLLRSQEQKAFPVVMRYLVTLGQGEEEVPNRRTVPYRDFVASEGADQDQKAGAKGFVDLFIEKRLLVVDTDPQGEVTVSVAHEALLREWQRVKEWLTENREFLRMRDRLDSSLKLWLSRGKQKDDLLGPGLPLAEGEKLVKDFGPSLSREQTGYVYASVNERKRRKRAQERIRYAVMAAISVLAIIAGLQWLRAERQRESVTQALKSEAQISTKLKEQLRQASWTSFNQAERQFQLGEWREGIALLARAIKFDPENPVASERFFQELIVHREKALPLPIASFAHQASVECVAFSSDGALILTASLDNTAKLWEVASGKLIASFVHQGVVEDVAFSPDGTRILTASEDKTAKLWNAATGKLITSFEHQDSVWHAAFSPDGARILTASADHSAKLWDAASGDLLISFQHQDEVKDAVFSPDGARILTASKDKTAKLWVAASGKLIASFQHQHWIWHAAFSPDGAWILTASADHNAKLWEAASGKLIASLQHQADVKDATFSPDGTRILTASLDHSAKLWDPASGQLIASFEHQDEVDHATFSPDGLRIVTASLDKTARLWDAVSGNLIVSFNHQGGVLQAVFSSDGTRILTASRDNTAKLWDASSDKFSASFAHQDTVENAAFSPDGARLLTASTDHSVDLWEVASGRLIANFEGLGRPFHGVFSPDGARVLTASTETNRADIWAASSGKKMVSFAHQDTIRDAIFSPDGARILTGSVDKTAKLWDAASGKLLASFDHEGEVSRVAFSPDGARILTASLDKTAKLWDTVSGKLLASLDHPYRVYYGAFSPSGARILTASGHDTAKLWDAASGKLIASFANLGPIWEGFLEADQQIFHFSPDGARFLTASADMTAKLWDAASGNLVGSFPHQNAVFQAEFGSNGVRILTASQDKTAKLWDAASGKLLATFNHPDGLYHAAFSPDSARILTASGDNTAKLWNAASGKLITSFDHEALVSWVGFSPDGIRILTTSWDMTAKLWDAATPVELARQVKEARENTARGGSSVSIAGSPALQVEPLSAIASGLEFSDDGSLVPVNEDRRLKLTKQLENLTQGLGPNACFIRWFFSTGGDRTIFPASDVKIGEWVDNALLTNPNVTEEWVRNALVCVPNHSLLHIALAGSESDCKRADFLRLFGLVRLPRNSTICTRAGEMLLSQDRPKLALVAVDQALLVDPSALSAQRLRLKVISQLIPPAHP
jgi:WD40 repeat protein/serine/threonine protein kinase/energy-coupling factor transporter ATP-binding protein EcfA2